MLLDWVRVCNIIRYRQVRSFYTSLRRVRELRISSTAGSFGDFLGLYSRLVYSPSCKAAHTLGVIGSGTRNLGIIEAKVLTRLSYLACS